MTSQNVTNNYSACITKHISLNILQAVCIQNGSSDVLTVVFCHKSCHTCFARSGPFCKSGHIIPIPTFPWFFRKYFHLFECFLFQMQAF